MTVDERLDDLARDAFGDHEKARVQSTIDQPGPTAAAKRCRQDRRNHGPT